MDEHAAGASEQLGALVLASVAVWDEQGGPEAVLDYTLGASRTQYVLAVRIDAEGRVVDVAMES